MHAMVVLTAVLRDFKQNGTPVQTSRCHTFAFAAPINIREQRNGLARLYSGCKPIGIDRCR